ncbi:MAG: hypothetical protein PVJ43_10370 [Gemmatimonadales bacterium]
MSTPELHRVLLHPLHQTGLAYMVTGAVAAIAYGEPRMTNDVDVVVQLGPGDAEALISAFASNEYYVPPLEVIEEEQQRPRYGHFDIIHRDTALRADIYLAGDDPLHEWAMARRRAASIGGDAIWFAPLEYVIVRKLEYFQQSGSDRHLRDIAGLLRVSGELVDDIELQRLIAQRDLATAWERVSGLTP